MAKPEEYQATLEEWFAQLQTGEPDPALTHKAAQQMAHTGRERLRSLYDDLGLGEDAQQVDEWLQSTWRDAPPTVASAFPVAFLQTTPAWVHSLKVAISQGQQWIYDSLGALCLAVTQATAAPMPIWGVKSLPGSHPIFRYELHPTDDLAWEVEVTGFSLTPEAVRVEVAILKPDDLDAALANVAVTLVVGDLQMDAVTDSGGVAEFAPVPQAKLGELFVRIASS